MSAQGVLTLNDLTLHDLIVMESPSPVAHALKAIVHVEMVKLHFVAMGRKVANLSLNQSVLGIDP